MKAVIEMLAGRLERKTGFPVALRGVTSNLFTGRFGMASVTVSNPPHYPFPDFMETGEVEARGSPASLLAGETRLRLLRLHLCRLTGLRLPSGRTNLEDFRHALERPENADGGRAGAGRRPGAVLIQRLSLRLDTIRIHDHAGEVPVVREYGLHWEGEFSEVRDPRVVGRILLAALEGSGLSRHQDPVFASLLPSVLWDQLG